MKRIPARRAALVAAALVVSSVVPGLAAAAAADPTFTVAGSVRDLAGTAIDGGVELRDGQGDYVAGGANDDTGFAFQAPAGHYTLHLETPVPGYSAGFQSGDEQAPGLFIDLPVDVAGDARFDLTVPIVDFPVHVVGHDGNPAGGVRLAGDSQGPVELVAGGVGTATLKNNTESTGSDGSGTLRILRAAPPATITASDDYETLGRAGVAADATSAVVPLDNPVLQGELRDARGPLPAAALDGAWVAFAGSTQPGGAAPWPYFLGDAHYRLQGDPGDRTLHVSNRNPWGDPDAVPHPASATLPGGWSFAAPYHLGGDATVDLTIPDAAPADVVVLDAAGQPVTGTTLHYSAVTQNPVELAPEVEATAIAADDIGDSGGHFSPMLFGPSAMTFSVGDGAPSDPLPISPGDHLTLHLADQSGKPGAPQNVTATAGDGKVKVTWDAPASDGGSPITGYTVTASHGSSNFKANFGPSVTAGAIRGLVNGRAYTVTVVAKNANGSGPASTPVAVTLDAAGPTTTTTAPGSGGNSGAPLGGAGSGDNGDPGTIHPGSGSGRSGYWLLGADGAVYSFGDAEPQGDASAALASGSGAGAGSGHGPAAVRAVDLEPTPSGQGYWVLDSAGRVHPFGDAPHLGDVVPARLGAGEEPASLSSTPTGAGYWVFTNRGRAIPFGDAAFLGDMSVTALNGPVIDSVATPSGRGYYMVAADGGIFAFGDARFAGSMGGRALNAPVRSLVPDGDGTGYWLVAADGGVFAFDAPFRGSMGGRPLNRPVRGMARYGDGYLMVGEDGGVFTFSDRPFTGSLGARPPAGPIVSVAALG